MGRTGALPAPDSRRGLAPIPVTLHNPPIGFERIMQANVSSWYRDWLFRTLGQADLRYGTDPDTIYPMVLRRLEADGLIRRVNGPNAQNRHAWLIEPVRITVTTDTIGLVCDRCGRRVADKRLRALGVAEEELPAVRALTVIEELEAAEKVFDPLTYQILYALAAGYSDEEVYALTGVPEEPAAAPETPPADPTFDQLIETEESRQTIFIPENEAELRRVFEGGSRGGGSSCTPNSARSPIGTITAPPWCAGAPGPGRRWPPCTGPSTWPIRSRRTRPGPVNGSC